jgi:deoxycytidylate deaminase
MPYTKAYRVHIKTRVAEIRKNTFCVVCGGQPIEWHHEDHKDAPNTRVAHLTALGFPLARIVAEISRCTALCRSCHMQEDGRLAALKTACPNKKGVVFVGPRPCSKCSTLAKPLRRGLCNRCNHQKRARERRVQAL